MRTPLSRPGKAAGRETPRPGEGKRERGTGLLNFSVDVDKDALDRALQVVARVAPARAPAPVLAGVLVEPMPGALRLSATNLDVAVRVRVPADCEGGDPVVLPARHLAELVGLAPPDCASVSLSSVGEDAVDVRLTDAARHTVRAIQGPFPELPDDVGETAVTMNAAPLADAIRRTAFAAATTPGRPVLTGVRFRLGPDGLDALATDATRVAHVRVGVGALRPDGAPVAVVPADACATLAQLLPADGDARLSFGGDAVVVSAGDLLFRASTLAWPYPDVLGLLPGDDDFDVTVRTDRSALALAIERAALAASALRDVRVTVMPDAVRLSAQADHSADEVVSADVDGPTGWSRRFNAQLVLDGLRRSDGDAVVWEFVSSADAGAARIRPADDGAAVFRYYVLPFRDG